MGLRCGLPPRCGVKRCLWGGDVVRLASPPDRSYAHQSPRARAMKIRSASCAAAHVLQAERNQPPLLRRRAGRVPAAPLRWPVRRPILGRQRLPGLAMLARAFGILPRCSFSSHPHPLGAAPTTGQDTVYNTFPTMRRRISRKARKGRRGGIMSKCRMQGAKCKTGRQEEGSRVRGPAARLSTDARCGGSRPTGSRTPRPDRSSRSGASAEAMRGRRH